jgi:hypothetical protein
MDIEFYIVVNFLGKDGKPLKTIFNERREKHKYFYSKPKDSESLF